MAEIILSIAICTHNEGECIRSLLSNLALWRNESELAKQIEINIVDDFSTDEQTRVILSDFASETRTFNRRLAGDFAAQKNYLNSVCRGSWILNLDADESITHRLFQAILSTIRGSSTADVYTFARLNVVHDLTLDHVKKWNLSIGSISSLQATEEAPMSASTLLLLKTFDLVVGKKDGKTTYLVPLIHWPSHKRRLYRNVPNIYWKGTVHERISGFSTYDRFPTTPEYSIWHVKSIAVQERQNAYYQSLKNIRQDMT